jgi:corrinoid protein of di/trimethylamine methyltransferase
LEGGEEMSDFSKLRDAVLQGDVKSATALAKEAVAQNADVEELVNKYMIPAMSEMGSRYETGDCYVPELLISARAMKTALELLRPLLVAKGVKPVGRVVIGTVKGDLHDIGKNLVGSLLEGSGYEVIDLGVDVPPEKFVAIVKEQKPRFLALSALLTTTMTSMRLTIDELIKAGLRDQVKVLIGGAPVTQGYADEIGADGYSDNASGAVGLARKLGMD